MASLQLYDQLLQFPLFQGLSRDELMQVAGHTKFDFQKHPSSKTIIKENDTCSHMYFLLSGTLRMTTRALDHSYAVDEQVTAPYMIQPESVFGYHQQYTHEFFSLTPVNLLRLDRHEVMRLSGDFLVFRINLLNIFATQSQKFSMQQWKQAPTSLPERIARFFVQHSVYPAGAKTFHILMKRLAAEVNDSRLDVSRALNAMQADGLLTLYRGRIEIPQLERLLM